LALALPLDEDELLEDEELDEDELLEELVLDELEDELDVEELLLELLVLVLDELLLEELLLDDELVDVLPPQAANNNRATDAGIKERIMVDSRVDFAGFIRIFVNGYLTGKVNGKPLSSG
jgi:hypothetical protein